ATNVDTNVSITRVTNKAGEYSIPALKQGTYRVSIKMPGFSDYVKDQISLQVGTNLRVDAVLAVGSTDQIVVNENALELETDTSQKQQVITGEQVESFPLQSLDYTDMLRLASGVTQDAAGEDLGTSSTTREASFNINGMRSTYNNYLLDGIDNNAHGTSNQGFSNQVIQPDVYSIAQFSIVTTLPPAEFGRSAAGIINTVLKSGTNKMHGLVYEAIQNTIADANGFFVAHDANGNVRKTTLQSNRFGGNIGGPIFRGKYFFFVDYNGYRRIRQNVNQSNIPSVNYHQLIIFPTSASTTTNITNPYTGAKYPNTRPLPRNVLDPIALAILDAMPMPNNNGASTTSISANLSVLQRFINSRDAGDIRLDGQINERTSAFIRVSQSKEHDLDGPTLPPPLSGGNGYFRTINQQVAIGVTRQIRATQLLEIRLGASYSKGGKLPIVLGDPRTFGVKGLPTDPRVFGGLTSIGISGFSGIGRQSTNPQWQYPFFFNPKVTYSYLIGHHNFKAGYEFGYMRQTIQDVNPIYGSMTFDSAFTESTFSDFLFGAPSEIDKTNLYVAHVRQGGHSAFLQDDWKILPKLTLNLGVRYEYASHFYDKDDRLTNYDPILTPVSGQLRRATSGGSVYQKQLVDPDLNDFMPRIG
ncbi:MAG: TonB-dependent receptor, partial [Bryocella sp.]